MANVHLTLDDSFLISALESSNEFKYSYNSEQRYHQILYATPIQVEEIFSKVGRVNHNELSIKAQFFSVFWLKEYSPFVQKAETIYVSERQVYEITRIDCMNEAGFWSTLPTMYTFNLMLPEHIRQPYYKTLFQNFFQNTVMQMDSIIEHMQSTQLGQRPESESGES